MTILLPNNDTKAKVIFTSTSRNINIEFFPYDFEFSDTYKPEWNSYEGFGRMDPIMVYKRTSRDASLSFNVVADDTSSAENNFRNLQNFIQCLYGTYEGVSNSATPRGPAPPPAEKPAGAITNPNSNIADLRAELSTYGAQIIKTAPLFTVQFMNLLNKGQYVVAINSFKHTFKFDSGATSFTNGKAIPGEFNLSIGMKILHTSIPGVNANNYG